MVARSEEVGKEVKRQEKRKKRRQEGGFTDRPEGNELGKRKERVVDRQGKRK